MRQEVEALLAEDAGAENFLERPALDAVVANVFDQEPSESWIGRSVGSYRILSFLGKGGMGEVYRAQDTTLRREVALKLLPETFAHDPERVARFRREAQLLASLNHNNIGAIYQFEQSVNVNFLVLEMVPGETLRERIVASGPMPLEEALGIAKQIAEALEAAHEKGIIHRDLKPANIKVTAEGKVKVLDFGLAKAFGGDETASDPSESPLVTDATGEGTILGTAAYMSPEQARGKKVDKRADMWAFGCVLYELLTGKQAFEAETVTETLAAVLKAEPDWALLPPTTPAGIRVLLRRCLQKDLTRRLRDATDARIEIEDALSAPSPGEPISAAVPARPVRRRIFLWGLGFVLVALLASLATWNLKPTSAPVSVSRFTIKLPPGQRLAGPDQPALAISPDGTHLVYAARTGGVQQLYLRAMDSVEVGLIAGTEGATAPFFSPDGQWVGFFTSRPGKLQKVSISGGAALTLSAGFPGGASWGSQGIIAFPQRINSSLQQVPEAGGVAKFVTELDIGENSHRWPEYLPDGRALLFVTSPNAGGSTRLAVQTVRTGERKNLVQGATQPHYALPGYLVYAQGGTLMAAPFDPQHLALTDAAVPVVEGILQSPSTGAAQYSFSSTGSLVYVSGGIQGSRLSLVWVSRKGVEQPLAAPLHAYFHPRVSPDGQRVAVAVAEQGNHIWIYDLALETLTPLTFGGNGNNFPVWTPDSSRVAFHSNREGEMNLFWQLADGSGGLEPLTTPESSLQPNSFSPDGQLLAFRKLHPTTGNDIWVLRLKDRKTQPFLQTQFFESGAQFSPDGHWLAYFSDESGRNEVYVQPYPGPGGKWQVSNEGGREPIWNPNGRELFYRSGEKMMTADVTTQPVFSAGKPKMLFEGRYQPTGSNQANFSVSPDGQRFLMIKTNEQDELAPTEINVVLNWFEELKRKVPVK